LVSLVFLRVQGNSRDFPWISQGTPIFFKFRELITGKDVRLGKS
jgi:hypothetical protein